MAEKKKIKGIKDNSGSGDGATITLGEPNPRPNNNSGGTVAAPVADITFEQAHYKALCFNVDDIVNVESITSGGATVITGVRRIVRGTVLTTANNNSGTIEENKSKKIIAFKQPNLKELKIAVGTEVKYDLIPNLVRGGEIAVNVEVQP